MSKISQAVSDIVGVRIPEGKWKQYFPSLDAQRLIYGKNAMLILFEVCQQIEEQEKVNKELEDRLNVQEQIISKSVKHVTNRPKPNAKVSA